jgi:hypothetical protein
LIGGPINGIGARDEISSCNVGKDIIVKGYYNISALGGTIPNV